MLGILIGVRLGESILDNLETPIRQMNIVSASEIALQWIKSSRKPAFVSNQKDRAVKSNFMLRTRGFTLSSSTFQKKAIQQTQEREVLHQLKLTLTTGLEGRGGWHWNLLAGNYHLLKL